MLFAVISGFIIAAITPAIFRFFGKKSAIVVSTVPLALFVWFASLYSKIASGETIREVYEWIPSMGVNLSFNIDGLSLLFALIITGIGTVVFSYASAYLSHDKYITRFYVYILMFMASMLGVVTSDNIFALFVFWELTSISSYLLIGYYFYKEESRFSALQALLVTGMGGLALLAGLIILYLITGTTEISEMAALNNEVISSTLYTGGVILILLGAFTKSAQFPFHFWLPNAMAAPSPVSAYLHSATMVKAGIFLMARLNPVLGGDPLWQNSLMIFGGITMILAGIVSLKQTDLKKLLAYSTVSVLGTLTFMIGIGTEMAIRGMIIYLLAHSLFKASLFLVAGSIDHETGTRDVTRLSGLAKLMPVTAFIAVFAALSKMGFIPFFGFIGKETLYEATLHGGENGIYLFAAVFIGGVTSGFVALTVGVRPFIGKISQTPKKAHETPLLMYAGPIVIASLGLIFGVLPDSLTGDMMRSTSRAITGTVANFELKLWHGFNPVLGLSLLTLVIAFLLYKIRERFVNVAISASAVDYLKPSKLYEKGLALMLEIARAQTVLLQNGYMRYYIVLIILSALGLAGYALFTKTNFGVISPGFAPSVSEVIIVAMMIAATIVAVKAKSRLGAIASLGVVGYGVAVIFIMYGAPDLALTQFAIETLTVILFVLAIYRLPKYLPFSNTSRRLRDFVIASLSGVFMTVIVLLVTSGDMVSELKTFFAENSLPLAKGKNVVNVILVDFRALDTMGEITVLAIAAIGVFALVKLRMEGKK